MAWAFVRGNALTDGRIYELEGVVGGGWGWRCTCGLECAWGMGVLGSLECLEA